MNARERIGILHYTSAPVTGGVENIITEHARLFAEHGFPVTVISGHGEQGALPEGAKLALLPLLDSQHPQVLEINRDLEAGKVPPSFAGLSRLIERALKPVVAQVDHLFIHNVLFKHFNLPLTAALCQLIDSGDIPHIIAWAHDLSWTSAHSKNKLFPGYPWDLLRRYDPRITYVAISQQRQRETAELLGCKVDDVHVVYGGLDVSSVLGLTPEGEALIRRLGLFGDELVALMPVRITQAKNIETGMRVTAQLVSQGISAHLVVTGPPDPHDPESTLYFETLRALRSELGLEKRASFVYEEGPEPGQPYLIGSEVVGDLLRVSDLMLMPSWREGFGLPVLEAGLAGVPVFSTPIPAALEAGAQDIHLFAADADPEYIAGEILAWATSDPVHRLRRRVREQFTWEQIFQTQMLPLLQH